MEFVSYGRPALPPPRSAPVLPPPRREVPPSTPGAPGADPERVDWVDIAKGISIVLVVILHATLGVEHEAGREGFMHMVVAFAKPFRMPALFLVSGLFLSRVIDRDWRRFGDKRVLHFAYFYLLWFVIQSVIKFWQISDGGSPALFGQHLLRGLVDPFSTLWFIYLLAIVSAVTKLLRRVPAPPLLAVAVALQIIPIDSGAFVLDQFCDQWVYFVAGWLFAPLVFRIAAACRERPGLALPALLAWAIANASLALTASPSGGPGTLADLPGVSLLAGFAGALATVAAAGAISRFRLAAPLRHAGAHSIAIYLTFFLPMAATRSALVTTGALTDVGLASAIVAAVAVVVPLGFERLARGTRLDFLYRRPDWARLVPAPREAVPPVSWQPAG